MKINNERLHNLLNDMINIYSPSGKEAELVDFLEEYLRDKNIPVVRQMVEKGRYNLLVLPKNQHAEVVFMGHIDTVTAYDLDNYQSHLEKGELFGLGSADMKGGCAAMIEAFLSFREQSDKPLSAALALVVGEEETGDGAIAFCEDYHYSWAIVGEPTSLKPCFTHYGYIETKINTKGKRMHASMAKGTNSAINSMLKLLLNVTAHLDNDKNDVIYNIRDVASTHAGFVVADACEAWIDLHVPPHYPIGNIVIELEELLSNNLPEKASLSETLTFTTIHAGYMLPDKGNIPLIIQSIYKNHNLSYEVDSFLSDSDATLLWQAGIKPVMLGPGSLAKAHTEDESILVEEVNKAAEIYLEILNNLSKLD